MSLVEFKSEAELRERYKLARQRTMILSPPTKAIAPPPKPIVVVTTETRKPWQPPIVQQVEIASPPPITLNRIKQLVCYRFNIPMADLVGPRRNGGLIRPRQIAMYLCKTLTVRSLPEIGRQFGNRDHTTVLHGYRRIAERRPNDTELNATLSELEIELRAA